MENKLTPYDLRIGDMLTFKDKIFTVAGFSSPQQVRLYDGMGADQWEFIDTLNPIPLSEEWLLKLGFEKVDGKDVFENLKLPYLVKNGMMLFYNEGEHNKGKYLLGFGEMRAGVYYAATIRWIDYLHEVQNAFALTGTELIIETQNKQ